MITFLALENKTKKKNQTHLYFFFNRIKAKWNKKKGEN